jgi:tetratricopeptide (TPR) repeat protein
MSRIAFGDDQRDSQYNEVTTFIANLRTQLEDVTLSESVRALLFIQLGTYLTFKDIHYHEDGFNMREEALEAYNNAIELSLDERTIQIKALHKKGMLIKLMSRGSEAIEAHDKAYILSKSDADRSVSLQFKAAAVSMMGNPKGAEELYRQALKLAPSQLGIYYPLVGCLAEINQTAEEWTDLLEEMEGQIKRYDGGDIIEDKEVELSFEYTSGYKNSAFYWALYIAADKTKKYSAAWTYLKSAHEFQIANVGLSNDTDYIRDQKNKIVNTFTPGKILLRIMIVLLMTILLS